MNGLDIALLVLVVLLAIRGFSKGLIREVFSIGGVILGFYIALKFVQNTTHFLGIEDVTLAKVVGFIVVFLTIVVVTQIVGALLSRFLKLIFLGFVDRLLGMVLGMLEAMIIAGMIVSVLARIKPVKEYVYESRIGPFLVQIFTGFGERYFEKGQNIIKEKVEPVKKIKEMRDERL